MSLPKRGTGLSTGRAGERRYGQPRTDAERTARHYGNPSLALDNTWKWILGIAGVAVAGFIIWKLAKK